jgi:hypothetical protein
MTVRTNDNVVTIGIVRIARSSVPSSVSDPTTLSPSLSSKDKSRGVRVTLTCYNCREYDSSAQPQEAPIHLSKERTTMRACLQKLLKRLQEKHNTCAEDLTQKASTDAQAAAAVHTPNVMQTIMLFQQAKKRAQAAQDHTKVAQDQAKVTKEVALEAEKDNDTVQKEVQKLQRVMEPKRARTNATTANDGTMSCAMPAGIAAQTGSVSFSLIPII